MSQSVIQEVRFPNFSWRFEVRERIDVEWVVEHLMRATAFHVHARIPYDVDPVSRSIKDALIRDNRII